jgi:hypothetical protein
MPFSLFQKEQKHKFFFTARANSLWASNFLQKIKNLFTRAPSQIGPWPWALGGGFLEKCLFGCKLAGLVL